MEPQLWRSNFSDVRYYNRTYYLLAIVARPVIALLRPHATPIREVKRPPANLLHGPLEGLDMLRVNASSSVLILRSHSSPPCETKSDKMWRSHVFLPKKSKRYVRRITLGATLISMQECTTNALVLELTESGELDMLAHLYTEKLGRVTAKAKSARKIISKLMGHLQPLTLTRVRLVQKNGFQIVDALGIARAPKTAHALAFLSFIKEMTVPEQRDYALWLLLKKSIRDLRTDAFSYLPLLKALGFDPRFAECARCGAKPVMRFVPAEQFFLCRRCASTLPRNGILLL